MVRNGEHKCSKNATPEEKIISEDQSANTKSSSGSPKEHENVKQQNLHPVEEEATVTLRYETIDEKNDKPKQKLAIPKDTDYYLIQKAYKPAPSHDGIRHRLITGMMTLVMGVMTMVRMTNNMPKRLTDATLYSRGINDNDNDSVKKMKLTRSYKMQPFVVSTAEYMSMMKRMGELEEKVLVLECQPHEMPAEKEDILNKALARVEALESQLAATNKSLKESISQQQELMAYLEKKKKKKRFFHF